MSPPGPPFVRKAKLEEASVVGARWWNEGLDKAERDTSARRATLIFLGITGGSIAFAVGLSSSTSGGGDGDEVESSLEALELQRRTTWDVGGTDRQLAFGGATALDVEGDVSWRTVLLGGPLDEVLRPTDARLQPFYDPTLFQAPAAAGSKGLMAALTPIHLPSMDEAYERGRALAALLKAGDRPRGVGVIVDVPGPDAVAVGAGLAEVYAPVFAFGNWPHPLGVVSSHLTLAAALYYVPRFVRTNQARGSAAPPAIILDSNRLGRYRDEATEFDNRYLANLPSAASWKALGVEQLLYVRPDGQSLVELDDLNADLTSFEHAGIGVRAVALTDFQPEGGAATERDASAPASATTRTTVSRYYWGGSSSSHGYFWSYYGWGGRPVRAAPAVSVSRASAYRPVARPTMFTSRAVGGGAGIGKQKPSGFGRVSVRTARSGGAITGVKTGRTGSFGRSRSFSSSG